MKASDIVVTTTPSRRPLIDASMLHPGLHVTAMGSDAPEKNELEPECLVRAHLLVADRVSQCEALGELRSAVAAGLIAAGDVPELGAVVTGRHPGRASAEAVTICDLTGTGAQDTAIASHAVALARRAGAGTTIAA